MPSKWDGWGYEKRLAGKGRCAVAEIDLEAGAVVLREAPYSAVLHRDQFEHRCDYTLQLGNDLKRCTSTGLRFSSRGAQRQALGEYYERERSACLRLQSAGRCFSDLSPALRLAARSLWRAEASDNLIGIPWVEMLDHWHTLSRDRQAELRCMAEGCADIVRKGRKQNIEKECGDAVESPDALGVARLLAAIAANAVVITDDDLRDIGLGLYLNGSVFNHSEEPNCVQAFMGRELVVRTRHAVRKGEELTITYSELAEASFYRRAHMQTKYQFDPCMKNGLLTLPKAVALRDNLLTEVEMSYGKSLHGGPSWSPDFGVASEATSASVRDSDVATWLHELHHRWKAAGALEKPSDRLVALQEIWDAACCSAGGGASSSAAPGKRLGQRHAMTLRVARDAMDASVEATFWTQAAAWSRVVCEVEADLYPNPWPVSALSLARLAKLELLLGRFSAACEAGRLGLAALSALGWDDRDGANGATFTELRQIVEEASAESRCRSHARLESRRPVPEIIEAPCGSVIKSAVEDPRFVLEAMD